MYEPIETGLIYMGSSWGRGGTVWKRGGGGTKVDALLLVVCKFILVHRFMWEKPFPWAHFFGAPQRIVAGHRKGQPRLNKLRGEAGACGRLE